MPVTKFACAPGKPTHGKAFKAVTCITKCPHQCMSPYLMAAIASSNQRNHHKGRYLSATSLTGCARKLKLERTENYSDYYHSLYYAFRGTITHTVVEEAAEVDLGDGKSLLDYGFLSEWRMQIGFCFNHGGFPIPTNIDPTDVASLAQIECPDCCDAGVPHEEQETFILGGTLDGAEALWDQFDEETGILPCKLHDLKTMQEYAVVYFVKGDPKNTLHPTIKDAYVIQARIYAYLASQSLPPEALRKRGVKQIRMVESHIQAFAMGTAPWTGGGTFRWKDNYRNPLKDWPMHPIDLGTDEWVEDFIKTSARPIYDSLILNKTRGPVCEPERSSKGSHSWACDFCAFYGSELCPNPKVEYDAILNGFDPESAFVIASKQPIDPPDERVGELNEKDLANIEAFFARRSSGVTNLLSPTETGAPAEQKKDRKVKPKTPVLQVDVAQRDKLTGPQEKIVTFLSQGMEIHEELVPKRQAVLLKDNAVQPHKVGAKQIDALVKAGWIVGTEATSGSFVRWKLKEVQDDA